MMRSPFMMTLMDGTAVSVREELSKFAGKWPDLPKSAYSTVGYVDAKYLRAHVPRMLGTAGIAFELRTVSRTVERLKEEGERVLWLYQNGFGAFEPYLNVPMAKLGDFKMPPSFKNREHELADTVSLPDFARAENSDISRMDYANNMVRWVLRDWELHPALTSLEPGPRQIATQRIHAASTRFVTTLLEAKEMSPGLVEAALGQWAYDSQILDLLVATMPPPLSAAYRTGLDAKLLQTVPPPAPVMASGLTP
jgi:hypothetical protein